MTAASVPIPAGGVTLDASLPQYLNGVLYTFRSWEDRTTDPVRAVQNLTSVTATFIANAAISVTVTTDPPGLWFSVNGIERREPWVTFFQPGLSLSLNTAAT